MAKFVRQWLLTFNIQPVLLSQSAPNSHPNTWVWRAPWRITVAQRIGWMNTCYPSAFVNLEMVSLASTTWHFWLGRADLRSWRTEWPNHLCFPGVLGPESNMRNRLVFVVLQWNPHAKDRELKFSMVLLYTFVGILITLTGEIGFGLYLDLGSYRHRQSIWQLLHCMSSDTTKLSTSGSYRRV